MKSTIEWTDRVWNFLTGCTRISQGCKFCYMFILAMRLRAMGQEKYRNGTKLTVHEHEIANPYTWKKPSMVFVNSMSDIFHEDVPDNIIIAAWKVMNETPQHTYQVLTKRPERLFEIQDKLNWTPNIWMGVSVENEAVLHRVDTLRTSKALVKWISAEPLIGALSNINLDGIHWVVAGAESGISKNIRPVKKEWIVEVMNKCRDKGIPFFFKQWGKKTFNPNPDDPTILKEHPQHAKGGCQLDGKVYREFPSSNSKNLNEIKSTNMKTDKSKSEMTQIVSNLSPFKRLIGEALISGEKPETLTDRLAQSRPMPRKTAQAYVTMVIKLLGVPNSQAVAIDNHAKGTRPKTDSKSINVDRIMNLPSAIPILKTQYCKDSEKFDEFIEEAQRRGYEYCIYGFPGVDSEPEIRAVCKGKLELAEVFLSLSVDYCLYVEVIKYFDDYELN